MPGPLASVKAALQQFAWPSSDPNEPGAGAQTSEQEYVAWLDDLNDRSFYWRVWFVASAGFCVDSYHLFSANVFLPAFGYIYWDGDSYASNAVAFNCATLGASAVGQLLFGFLADVVGRRSLYGIELVIVIVSTLGMLQSSQGYSDQDGHTWSITAWIIIWRCVMGLGIGAEYPLSACIGAEWSSPRWRGRVMSSIFLMQPIGQLCAQFAGLTALRWCGGSRLGMDSFWRYVVGIGAIPTVLALGSRLIMPEGGRYYFEVTKKVRLVPTTIVPNGATGYYENDSPESLWDYLYTMGHWRYLVGTSICWFLLDVAFYGIGFNNPSTLSKLWSPHHLNFAPGLPVWLTTSTQEFTGTPTDQELANLIPKVLETNITHAIYTVSLASIVGSLAMVYFIDYLHRKHFLTISFALLGGIMIILAASFSSLFHHEDSHWVLIIFWVVMSALFSFGPNTLTFIIPAEVFPTRYRCTFYGVAAASGKMGALLVQVVLYKKQVSGGPNNDSLRWALLAFAVCMFLGALCSHLTLPSVQVKRPPGDQPPWYEDVPLEELPPPPPSWTSGMRRRVRDRGPVTTNNVSRPGEIGLTPIEPPDRRYSYT